MLHLPLSVLAVIALVACDRQPRIAEGPFDPKRDGEAAIECYTAFILRALGNPQYDLRLTKAEVDVHQGAGGSRRGWRIQPYFDAAAREAGGKDAAALKARVWMAPIEAEIRKQPTLEGRRAAFQHLIVAKTDACHALMNAWGAPPLATP
jgi:hypothetical protein